MSFGLALFSTAVADWYGELGERPVNSPIPSFEPATEYFLMQSRSA